MIHRLELKNVGPAPALTMDLAPRLNLVTGDNGLGKSFLLDVLWWALTRRWPHDLNPLLTSGYPARPTDIKKPATIGFHLQSKTKKSVAYKSKYTPRDEAWLGKPGRPWNPGLVLYAHSDGGFSLWDPARNYWKKKGGMDVQDRLSGYVFSAKEVWDGLEANVDGKPTIVCNGLIRDWASWIRERGGDAEIMSTLLEGLAPEGESLSPGPLVRISLNDARDLPSIRTPYSDCVPILHASSGVRRIVGLAYMLVWSWREHLLAAKILGEEPTSQVVMLFDEMESHLHPRWQRSILKSVLAIVHGLHNAATVQLVAVTHSPLIMASAEPLFDAASDAWFDLDMDRAADAVTLTKRPFARRGTAGRWLTSEAFGLHSEGRSLEAERAIADAERILERFRLAGPVDAAEVDRVDGALREVLPDIDRFWIRWSSAVDELKGLK